MLDSKYQVDNELKVVQDPQGYRQMGIRKSFKLPSDAFQGIEEAAREYLEKVQSIETDAMHEIDIQESQIERKLEHQKFFEEDSKRYKWGFNQSFDRLRIQNISLIDSLEDRKRSIRLKRNDLRRTFAKEIRDAKMEFVPFKKLFI